MWGKGGGREVTECNCVQQHGLDVWVVERLLQHVGAVVDAQGAEACGVGVETGGKRLRKVAGAASEVDETWCVAGCSAGGEEGGDGVDQPRQVCGVVVEKCCLVFCVGVSVDTLCIHLDGATHALAATAWS